MRSVWVLATAGALLGVLTSLVQAECPNGCSGNGDCMAKDMCNCYKNFQGNDCSDRTCLFARAFVDTPKGDINMDQSRTSTGWILTNSQQHPAGTYEYFNPDAKQHEAHYYMECGNKGICDRTTGLCQCFDGYEGAGCRRTTCPNKCSGHGTCESLRELGAKAGGTLFGLELATGPVVYDLWDGNTTYGCRCDPWYFGPDCAKRNCKVGVDPLFLAAGTPNFETFVVHAYIVAGTIPANSWIRLRLFDYYGEAYLTDRITVLDDATAGNGALNAAAVKNAILAIPNLTYRDVKCEATGAGTELAGYKSTRPAGTGLAVTCQFFDNPGKMRIPEAAAFDFPGIAVADQRGIVVTTAQQGHDNDWFTVQSNLIYGSTSADGLTITLSSGNPTTTVPANTPQLIKFAQHILLAVSSTATTLVLQFPFKHTIGTSTVAFTTFAPTGATAFTLTEGEAVATTVNVGDDIIDLGTTAPTVITTGSLLFFHNAFYSVQRVWLDNANYKAKLDKPFGGSSNDGGASGTTLKPYKVTMPTDRTKIYNYVSECSGRGLCSYDTGICACFRGYTNDNCNTQNILAL
ncbi:hypothetical protein PINS_up011837 [Pythium insidiosum]|nr:hypothetical protein PINS_up011837 [Pythium insidiosum]